MANYLCRATNPRVPDYLVKKVSVPANTTLHAGDIVMLKALDSGIADNYQVYTGSKPATADLGLRAATQLAQAPEQLLPLVPLYLRESDAKLPADKKWARNV